MIENEKAEMNTQQNTNSTPEESGRSTEKLFTQADLDRIIKERLGRARAEKENLTQQLEAREKTLSNLESREKDLRSREAALKCRSYLMDKGYPAGLMEILDTTDAEAFEKKADLAYKMLNGFRKTPPLASREYDGSDEGRFAEAFSKEQKHEPRRFPHYTEE